MFLIKEIAKVLRKTIFLYINCNRHYTLLDINNYYLFIYFSVFLKMERMRNNLISIFSRIFLCQTYLYKDELKLN